MACYLCTFCISELPAEPETNSGLIFAIVGVALGFVEQSDQGEAHLIGDLIALVGVFGWAGIALCARAKRISEEPVETILFVQLLASGPL